MIAPGGDELVLRFVFAEIGTPQSPQDLRGMVQRRLEDATVYEEEVYRFRRHAPGEREVRDHP